tara:strand:+ start:592 stop:720 length:129 start_codon:yes stop_codon:yes gene_type:complete
MDWLLSYFQTLSTTKQVFTVIAMGAVGFIIVIISIKRWLIKR